MKDKKEIIFELLGRTGVLLAIAVIMNRTQWYQDLNGFAFRDIYAWIISFAIVFIFVWVSVPYFKLYKLENYPLERQEGKHEN